MLNNVHLKVELPSWAVPHWWKVAYKIPPQLDREFLDLTRIKPDAKFEEAVGGYVAALISEGKMPPADILTPVLNMANDFLSGRDILIRTGDYITLQQHFRSHAPKKSS